MWEVAFDAGQTVGRAAKVLAAIFGVLHNGAKCKALPRDFGWRCAVHAYFHRWTRKGIFENIMRDAGLLVEERGGYRLYECFIDATFSKARGGGGSMEPSECGPRVAEAVHGSERESDV